MNFDRVIKYGCIVLTIVAIVIIGGKSVSRESPSVVSDISAIKDEGEVYYVYESLIDEYDEKHGYDIESISDKITEDDEERITKMISAYLKKNGDTFFEDDPITDSQKKTVFDQFDIINER